MLKRIQILRSTWWRELLRDAPGISFSYWAVEQARDVNNYLSKICFGASCKAPNQFKVLRLYFQAQLINVIHTKLRTSCWSSFLSIHPYVDLLPMCKKSIFVCYTHMHVVGYIYAG